MSGESQAEFSRRPPSRPVDVMLHSRSIAFLKRWSDVKVFGGRHHALGKDCYLRRIVVIPSDCLVISVRFIR